MRPPYTQSYSVDVAKLQKLLRRSMETSHELGQSLVSIIKQCEVKGVKVPREINLRSQKLALEISELEDQFTELTEGKV